MTPELGNVMNDSGNLIEAALHLPDTACTSSVGFSQHHAVLTGNLSSLFPPSQCCSLCRGSFRPIWPTRSPSPLLPMGSPPLPQTQGAHQAAPSLDTWDNIFCMITILLSISLLFPRGKSLIFPLRIDSLFLKFLVISR